MGDRDDLFLFVVVCFVCFLVGVLIGTWAPNADCVDNVFYVVEGSNFTLPEGLRNPRVLENITFIESSGLLVVENLSMLEAFRDE